ncbi:MAG: ribose-phosphate pyrophosphokinase [Defluviitaleaceae bacterium]|nr:ribose-phosphate pyrophosphokinase [Defluviitaleaceae bacterium]MCL2274837.1 ribose-phosphate pyrophosphokinase [Defluviitaleaceae bacterium]
MINPLGGIKVFAANANKQMAATIAKMLNVNVGKSEVTRFSDGEINMRINETVRGADVFIVQSTSYPVNDHLMELLIMIDAMKRSSAGRITAVIPYFGYARQDRRAKSHDPISAKLVANMLTTAGADRILSMDLHCPQIQGFFDIPMDHLRGMYVFVDYIKQAFGELHDVVVVSPDLGSVARCNSFAELLDVPLAIVDKRRSPNVADRSTIANFIGNVQGKIAVLLDDVMATGGSLCNAAESVMEHGARAVYACVTHPVLSEDAVEKIAASPLERLVVLDTIEMPPEKRHKKIEMLSVGELFAGAIDCIHRHESIGNLFRMESRFMQLNLKP